MRHLAIVALFLAAACGGKSDKAGTGPTPPEDEGDGSGSAESEPGSDAHEVLGTLKAIEDEAEGVCFVTIVETESGEESMFPGPELCGQGYEDYIDYEVSLMIDADGNAVELTTMSPD